MIPHVYYYLITFFLIKKDKKPGGPKQESAFNGHYSGSTELQLILCARRTSMYPILKSPCFYLFYSASNTFSVLSELI